MSRHASPVRSPRGTHLVRRQRSSRSEVGARPTRNGRPRYVRTASLARASQSPRGAASWIGQYEYDGFRILDRQGRSIASLRDIQSVGRPRAKKSSAWTQFSRASPRSPGHVPPKCCCPISTAKSGSACRRCLCSHRSSATMARSWPHSAFECGRAHVHSGTQRRSVRPHRRNLCLRWRGPAPLREPIRRRPEAVRLVADMPHIRSTLSLELRDPGVDITRGKRPHGEEPTSRSLGWSPRRCEAGRGGG